LLLTLLTSRQFLPCSGFGRDLFDLPLQIGGMRALRTLFLASGLLGAQFGGGLLGVGDGLVRPPRLTGQGQAAGFDRLLLDVEQVG
jgi:hypothetical protein